MTCIFLIQAQEKYILSGTVRDTKENLELVNVYIKELKQGTYTDSLGNYSFQLAKGKYHIIFSCIGYKTIEKEIHLLQSQQLHITLQQEKQLQEEVVITIDKKQQIYETTQGATSLSQKDLKSMPSLLGEPDPVKLLQHTASVATNGDGKTGLFVRGGNPDHTRILYNHATIYNPSHLLGVFSVFHPDAVKEASLYTSGISPEYSGLIGSFLDVRSSESIPERFSFNGSLGLISSRIHLTTPLSSQAALSFSARRSYITYLLKPLNTLIGDNDILNQSEYDFDDYNLSFIWKPSNRDHIAVHTYLGSDKGRMPFSDYNLLFALNWKNKAVSIKWQHFFQNNWFMEHILTGSQYFSYTTFALSNYNGQLETNIHTGTYKAIFNLIKKNHHLRTGYELSLNRTSPGNAKLTLNNEPLEKEQPLQFKNSQIGIFANDEIEWKKWLMNIGIRYTYYQEHKQSIGFHEWEPRVSLRYALTKQDALKASLTRHIQFMHLIPLSSSTGLPMDYWIPAGESIHPQRGWQVSSGYFHQAPQGTPWSWSAEVYYKHMNNQLENKNNLISIFEQSSAIRNLEQGKGWAYGIELSLQKQVGAWTGWTSYTLSKNMRQFDQINNGNPFLGYSDRRHDLSIMTQYIPNLKWKFAVAFVYSTGRPLSVPSSISIINGTMINEYTRYNSQRMPAYHRMDWSITRTFQHTSRIHSELNFSFYNVYFRKNAFLVLFIASPDKEKENSYTPKARQGSLFPIIPSISWSIYL